ncbi:MAG: helix-turn-helix transcriptional regulator, partial [Clostridia bacterium]|nr:helix-turn-helix transcriptional regulator [Clostridia bacterium]
VALLTPKEREIFDLYVAGQSTKDIMQKLNIKENTLKFHNKNIYGKLGVSSRKQLVTLALTCREDTPAN